MRKGTTPTHVFELPFEASLVKEVMVIYAQNDSEVLRKETKDCTIESTSTISTISVDLTQWETLLFNHKKNVQIQLRVLTTSDQALASQVFVVSAEKCLNNEVL